MPPNPLCAFEKLNTDTQSVSKMVFWGLRGELIFVSWRLDKVDFVAAGP
jgi:hypothetical protein